MKNEELDKKVAEKVMGWKFIGFSTVSNLVAYKEKNEIIHIDWHPSTNIAHAWQVVEKMIKDDYYFCIIKDDHTDYWEIHFGTTGFEMILGHAETAPLAICKAALKVKDEIT